MCLVFSKEGQVLISEGRRASLLRDFPSVIPIWKLLLRADYPLERGDSGFTSMIWCHEWKVGVNFAGENLEGDREIMGFHGWLHKPAAERYIQWYDPGKQREYFIAKMLTHKTSILDLGVDFTGVRVSERRSKTGMMLAADERYSLAVATKSVFFDPSQKYEQADMYRWLEKSNMHHHSRGEWLGSLERGDEACV